jgi:thiol-disulfide isomerase/thioredoxin/mono/diheme cytochrome c family protein
MPIPRAFMRRLSFALLLAVVAGSTFADTAKDPIRKAPRVLKPAEHGVGRLIADVAFIDTTGKAGKFSDFKDEKALVVLFTSTSCPISQKYAPSLARLEKEYREKGVAFVYVNPIASDSADDIAKAIKTHGFAGPYVHDKDGAFARAVGAKATTDAFLIDSARTVIYHGAVDDQYGQGYSLPAPRVTYLMSALDALLAGKVAAVQATEAPGCELDLKPDRGSPSAVTYHNQIARLVQAHCVECHRTGGVGPFSLDSYKDVVAHAGQIKKVIANETMPPWFAAKTEKGTSPWLNDRSLTAAETSELLTWLKGDKAEGNKTDAPRPRSFDPEWRIGKPDAIVRASRAVKVQAEGVMDYQHVDAETDFGEDKWVQALEVHPSARQVVHHILVFVLPPAKSGERHNPFDGIARSENEGFYAIYVPGNNTLVYPEGLGKKLPKGSKVRFQIHYTPNGTATEDRPELGLIFCKEKPKHQVVVAGVANPKLTIPPGADNHPVPGMLTVPFDVKIIAFLPHMHLRGKSFRYEATPKGRQKEILLDIPRYDFNWQLRYELAEPLALPKGSNLWGIGWYDNSAQNPANPNPAATVHWGKQTYDEMMLGYVEYYIP